MLGVPEAVLWERWTTHDKAATTTIDHRVWDQFLRTHLQTHPGDINRIAYGAVSDTDRRAVDAYVAGLEALPISRYNRQEQLAFWINLYNALTVKVVLAHYPVNSIMDIGISPGVFVVGPWGKKLVSIEGEMLSLDDIEHRILRPIWRDSRIHYALNCASYGCPNLYPRAYLAGTLEQVLDNTARDYINSDRALLFEDGDLYVSNIYRWFKDDFGGTDASVIAHLRGFAEPALQAKLADFNKISDGFYDWSLNDKLQPVESGSAGNSQFGRSKEEQGSATR